MITALILASLLGPGRQGACTASTSAPALDHAILVVRNLDAASAGFRARGFTLKQGRIHANNLLNRHLKFRDGTSLELMTVRGKPRDAMARDYAALAAEGEGGVYVALDVARIDAAKAAAAALGFAGNESSPGPWRFLSFPPESPAAAVFFGAGSTTVHDADSLLTHTPAVDGLAEAWVEGGAGLVRLLENLGAKRCGRVEGPDARSGERLALSRGHVVIVPHDTARRPRVLGVVLDSKAPAARTIRPHKSFWIRYQQR